MTDFDQLIKNKAEEAYYPYKPSAWKNFLKRSGAKVGFSGGQIALSVIAASVVVGAAVWGVSSLNSKSADQPQMQEEVSVDVVDTMENETVEIAVEETPVVTEKNVIRAKQTTSEPVETSSPEPVEQPAAVTPAKPQKKVTPRYGKPVLINVDTITELEATDEQLRNGHSRIF